MVTCAVHKCNHVNCYLAVGAGTSHCSLELELDLEQPHHLRNWPLWKGVHGVVASGNKQTHPPGALEDLAKPALAQHVGV
jgi:hypothetical protein